MREIKNEQEYQAILARFDELIKIVGDDTPKTDKNYIELDVLADLLEAYDKKHYPITPPNLAEVIRLRMDEMDISQKALAELLGVSPSRVSEYLNGKSEPTLSVARRISKKLSIPSAIVLGV